MIAISGILVIVAIGLLITGVLLTSDIYLWFVLGSIVVSLASAAFLVVGVFAGRGHGPTRGRTAKGSSKAASSKAKRKSAGKQPAQKRPAVAKRTTKRTEPAPAAADETEEVVVVPGRLRYHLTSCRQVTGRDTESRTVAEARGEGYAACTACRPDSVLAARAEAKTAGDEEPAVEADESDADAGTDAGTDEEQPEPAAEPVFVVSGQRRYHLASCQVIEDAREDETETVERTLDAVRADGLTPCTVCGAPKE